MRKISTFLAIVLTVLGFNAGATTYYVSNSGSNTNTALQAQNPATPYLTLSFAITAAQDGDIIRLAAGTYTGNVTVSKRVTIMGEGTGVTTYRNSLTLTAPGGSEGNRLVIKNLTLSQTSGGGNGINVYTSFVSLENLVINNYATGINVSNNTASPLMLQDLYINQCRVDNNQFYGFVLLTPGVTNGLDFKKLRVYNSTFNNNDVASPVGPGGSASGQGFQLNRGNFASYPGSCEDVIIKNCSFNDNLRKGIYCEMLKDAVIENISVINSGTNEMTQHAAGIDFNFLGNDKAIGAADNNLGIHGNIIINGAYVSGCGLNDPNGGGLLVKARNESTIERFNHPATVNGFHVINSTFTKNRGGIRFGESNNGLLTAANGPANNLQNLVVRHCRIFANSAPVATATLGKSTTFGLRNFTNASIDARFNYWGTTNPTYQSLQVTKFNGRQTNGQNTITGIKQVNVNSLPIGAYIQGSYATTNNNGLTSNSWNTTTQAYQGITVASVVDDSTIRLSANASATRSNTYYVYSPQDLTSGLDIQKISVSGVIDSSNLQADSVFVFHGLTDRGSFASVAAALGAAQSGDTILVPVGLTYSGLNIPSGVVLISPGSVGNTSYLTKLDGATMGANVRLAGAYELIGTTTLGNNTDIRGGIINVTGPLNGGTLISDSLSSISVTANADVALPLVEGSVLSFLSGSMSGNKLTLPNSVNTHNGLSLTNTILVAMKGIDVRVPYVQGTYSETNNIQGRLGLAVYSATGTNRLDFPIADENGNYRPIRLSFEQQTAATSYYRSEAVNDPAGILSNTFPTGINRISLSRYFSLAQTVSNPLSNITVRFNYDADEFVNDIANLRLLKDNGLANSSWVNVGGTGSAITTGTINNTVALTSLGNFALGNVTGGTNLSNSALTIGFVPVRFCRTTTEAVNFKVGFTATGTYVSPNNFQVELSDSNGSFTTPTIIGTTGDLGAGTDTINATLPDGLNKAIGYRMRVVSTNPAEVSPDNGVDIAVSSTPATPVITNSRPLEFCAGDSTVLSAPAGYAGYIWSTGGTRQSVVVKSTASVTAQVLDEGGCISAVSNTLNVIGNALPTKPILSITNGDAFICPGDSVIIKPTIAYTQYQWSTGANTDSIIVKAGTKLVLRGINANGCVSVSSDSLTITSVDNPAQPNITASGSTTFCPGDSVTLSAPNGFASYEWSNGSITQSVKIKTTDSLRVRVGSAFACLSPFSAYTYVTLFTPPAKPALSSTATQICNGDSIIVRGPKGFSVYQWSTGASSDSIIVKANATVNLMVTDANGCKSPVSDDVTLSFVSPPAKPVVNASDVLTFCDGDSVVLTATAGSAYLWSNGATSQSITVKATGKFTVTLLDGSCRSETSDTTTVVVNSIPVPTISANPGLNYCPGQSVTLTAPSGMTTYTWSTGENTQSITINGDQTVTLQIIDANGCVSTINSVTTSLSSNTPTVLGLNNTALWTNTNIFGAERQYGLLNSNFDANGNILAGVNPNTHTEQGVIGGPVLVSAANGTTLNNFDYGQNGAKSVIEVGGKLMFTSGIGDGVLQIDNDFNSNLSNSFQASVVKPSSITTDGQFVYTNDEVANGRINKWRISSTSPFRLREATGFTPPNIGGKVEGLFFKNWGGAQYVYAANGSTSFLREVYAVDANSGSATRLITAVPGTTKVNSVGVVTLNGQDLLLVADQTKIYVYRLGSATTVTSSSPIETIDAANLGLGDAINSIAVNNSRLFIAYGEKLSAFAFGSLPAFGITQQPSNASGCVSGNAQVSVNAVGAVSYQWVKVGAGNVNNGGNINGATSATLDITGVSSADSGLYYCVISNGCITLNTDTVLVTPGLAKPKSSNQTACFGSTIPSLSAIGVGTIQWYADRAATTKLFEGSTFNTGRTAVGNYKFYFRDSLNTCVSAIDSVRLTISPALIAPVAASVTSCAGQTPPNLRATGTGILRWYADSAKGLLVFSGSSFATGKTATGVYNYFVTDSANGCVSSARLVTLTLVPSIPAPAVISKKGCASQTIPLLEAQGNGTLIWYSNSLLTQRVGTGNTFNTNRTAAGTYYYWVVDSVGSCKSASSIVSLTIQPAQTAPLVTNVTACEGGTIPDLSANAAGVIRWFRDVARTQLVNTGSTFKHNLTAAGVYTFYVTQEFDSCISPVSVVALTINAAPTSPVVANDTACEGETIPTLTATAGGTIFWYSNSTLTTLVNQGATFSTTNILPGEYEYWVVNQQNGCNSFPSQVKLVINAKPAISQHPQAATVCRTSSHIFSLDFVSQSSATVQWLKNGVEILGANNKTLNINNASLTDTGSYQARITNAFCSVLTNSVKLNVTDFPVAFAGADQTVCSGQSLQLGAAEVSGNSYTWTSVPSGFTSVQANPTVNPSGSTRYNLLVTNLSSGCTNSASVTITVRPEVNAPSTQNVSLCAGALVPKLGASGSSSGKRIWYSDAALSNRIFEGDSLNTGASVAGTYTYYVVDSANGCFSKSSAASLTIKPALATPAVSSNIEICFGETPREMRAFGTNSLLWYSDAALSNLVATGTAYTPEVTTPGVMNYFIVQALEGCTSSVATITYTVKAAPTAPTANNEAVCQNEGIPSLTANAAGTIDWFSDAALTNRVATGGTFATGRTAAGTYTYYVTNTENGCRSQATVVSLTIRGLPIIRTNTQNSRACVGGTLRFSVSADFSETLNYQWSKGGTDISGATLPDLVISNASLSDTGNYAVRISTGTCQVISNTVRAIVDTLPVFNIAADGAICTGGTKNIGEAAQTGLAYEWRSIPAGFSSSAANPLVAPAQTTRYFVTVTNTSTGCSSDYSTTVTVTPEVSVPTASDVAVCTRQRIPALKASGLGRLVWYADRGLTTRITSGDSLVTGNTVPGVYRYWVLDSVGDCRSAAKEVSLTITPGFNRPILTNTEICEGSGTPTLRATAIAEVRWYADTSLSNLLFIGNAYTPNVTSPGVYKYFVTQQNGDCISEIASVEYTIKAIPTSPTANNEAACQNEGIPSLTANAAGTIDWFSDAALTNRVATGATFSTGRTAAGTYTYYVANTENGCRSQATVVSLTIRGLPIIRTNTQNSRACVGGTLRFSVSADFSETLNYQWTKGGTDILGATLPDLVISNASVSDTGNYSVRISTGTCQVISNTVRAIMDTLPVFNIAADGAICTGGTKNIGEAAQAGLAYEWRSIPAGFSSSAANPLVAPAQTTRYFVTVTNTSTGCSSEYSTTVTVTPEVSVPTASDMAVCTRQRIPALKASGLGTLVWYADRGLTTRITSGDSLVTGNTVPGVYRYWVLDSLGDCRSAAKEVSLTITPGFNRPILTNTEICEGSGTPTLRATAIAEVRWYADTTLSNLLFIGNDYTPNVTTPGVYKYFVTQQSGDCISEIASVTYTIKLVPAPPVVQGVSLCEGEPVPAFTASSAGIISWYADPQGLILLTTGNIFNSPERNAGTYTYYISRVLNGCKSGLNAIILTIRAKPAIIDQPRATAACVGSGAQFSVNATQASVYRWQKDGFDVPNGSARTLNLSNVSNADAGTYRVILSNAFCSDTSDDAVLTINQLPTLSLNQEDTICPDGTVAIGVAAQAGFSYEWSSEPPGFVSSLANPMVSPDFRTQYNLKLTNLSTGCVNNLSKFVTVRTVLEPSEPAGRTVLCINEGSSTYTTTDIGALAYNWKIIPSNAGVITPSGTSATVIFNQGYRGRAYVSVSATGICGTTDEKFTAISIVPKPQARFTANRVRVRKGELVRFTDLSTSANSWFWDFGNGTFSTEKNPVITFNTEGTYSIKLSVAQDSGCIDTIRLNNFITVLPPDNLYVPTAFTPNGDGENDQLFVYGENLTEVRWQVYDQLGAEAFSSTDLSKGWDGKKGGKEMPIGNYLIYVKAKNNLGETVEYKGTVSIVK